MTWFWGSVLSCPGEFYSRTKLKLQKDRLVLGDRFDGDLGPTIPSLDKCRDVGLGWHILSLKLVNLKTLGPSGEISFGHVVRSFWSL